MKKLLLLVCLVSVGFGYTGNVKICDFIVKEIIKSSSGFSKSLKTSDSKNINQMMDLQEENAVHTYLLELYTINCGEEAITDLKEKKTTRKIIRDKINKL